MPLWEEILLYDNPKELCIDHCCNQCVDMMKGVSRTLLLILEYVRYLICFLKPPHSYSSSSSSSMTFRFLPLAPVGSLVIAGPGASSSSRSASASASASLISSGF